MREELPQKFIPVKYNELEPGYVFYMSEMGGVFKYTFINWKKVDWWIVVVATDENTGLETEIKINPMVETPLFKTTFNSDWTLREYR